MRSLRWILGAAAIPAAALVLSDTLAVWDGAGWREWWRADAAPVRWTAPDPLVAAAVRWRTAQPGLETGTLRVAGGGEARRVEVVLARIDPARFELALHVRRAADGRALPWSVDRTPPDAALAINAGMFDAVGPWGWLVLDGQERQAPGRGPLSAALVVDSAGRMRLVGADSIASVRAAGGVRWAIQSYPAALESEGVVPRPLRAPGGGVNVEHRDARIAIGTLRDGRILVALTRFDAPGDLLDALPFGPTLPEMSAILGALGVSRAVFLDGGISAQMAVRRGDGSLQTWDALRSVPVALVARRRP